MALYTPTVDVHRGDPYWDYDEDENPRPQLGAHSALIRTLPAPRVPVGSKEEAK